MDLSSNDVEIDGEAVVNESKLKFPEMHSEIITKSRNTAVQDYFDSAYSSESIGYKSSSIGALPVQCSDSETQDSETKLNKKLESLTLHDEGIASITEEESTFEPASNASVEPASNDSDVIEVDLFETDRDGDTIIHRSIVWNLVTLTLTLIDLVEDVTCLNITNLLRQSPLHLAVLLRQVDVVQRLVERKADVTLRDHQGNTPLHIACRIGDRDAVEIIVGSFGNDVNARKKYFAMKNCEGLTCLHLAAQNKEYVIMGHLFAKGADVNIGDAKSGRTVLHYATEERDFKTIRLLLTHKDIDVDCKTFKGDTPLVMAYWRNYMDVVKFLKTKGAYFSYDDMEDSDDDWS